MGEKKNVGRDFVEKPERRRPLIDYMVR
jgi:hypothetical protein